MSAPEQDVHSRWFHVAVVAVFLAVVAAPWADPRPAAERSPEVAERRRTAPAPEFSWDVGVLNDFPRGMEARFDDTFGFRDAFLRGHSVVKLFGFGVTPTSSVLVGRDGWLFFTGSHTVEDYRGLIPFEESELEAWREMLEERSRLLAAEGMHYVFVLVPNKEEMYPDKMPAHLRKLGERRIDQFVAHMRARSDVDVLDLRDAFHAARAEEDPELPLYLPLGTHWNGTGSLVATRAIVEHLRPRFPGLEPLTADEAELLEMPFTGDSWGRAMYVDDLLPQRVVDYRPPRGSVEEVAGANTGLGSELVYRGHDPAAPSAVLVHDSFGPYLGRKLAWSFSRLRCVWSGQFPWAEVRSSGADVVIEEHVQRWLVVRRPQPAPPAASAPLDELPVSAAATQAAAAAPRPEAPPLLVLELPADAARVESVGEPARRESYTSGREGLEVSGSSRRDMLALPAVDVPAGGRLLLRLECWTREPVRLSVFHAAADEERPALTDRTGQRIGRGAAVVQIALEVPPGARRVFLRPPRRPGSIVLRRIELYGAVP